LLGVSANKNSVYVAGQVIKKLLTTFPDKVDGQQAVAERKARKVYETLDAYPDVYRVVPDKSVRSRMNICFRVIKVTPKLVLLLHA
jgi:phosphoserine aminotransferase